MRIAGHDAGPLALGRELKTGSDIHQKLFSVLANSLMGIWGFCDLLSTPVLYLGLLVSVLPSCYLWPMIERKTKKAYFLWSFLWQAVELCPDGPTYPGCLLTGCNEGWQARWSSFPSWTITYCKAEGLGFSLVRDHVPCQTMGYEVPSNKKKKAINLPSEEVCSKAQENLLGGMPCSPCQAPGGYTGYSAIECGNRGTCVFRDVW